MIEQKPEIFVKKTFKSSRPTSHVQQNICPSLAAQISPVDVFVLEFVIGWSWVGGVH
jgi:hypothetical protein